MSGLGELLLENARLRQEQQLLLQQNQELLRAQSQYLAQLAELQKMLEAVKASNEELAKRLAFIEEKAKRAKAV